MLQKLILIRHTCPIRDFNYMLDKECLIEKVIVKLNIYKNFIVSYEIMKQINQGLF